MPRNDYCYVEENFTHQHLGIDHSRDQLPPKNKMLDELTRLQDLFEEDFIHNSNSRTWQWVVRSKENSAMPQTTGYVMIQFLDASGIIHITLNLSNLLLSYEIDYKVPKSWKDMTPSGQHRWCKSRAQGYIRQLMAIHLRRKDS